MHAAVIIAVLAAPPLAVPTAAHAAAELAPVMLVLDASGSMEEAISGGTKMAAAKRAIGTLVGLAPEGTRLGLAVYGTGTGSSADEKAAGCRDISVMRKVGPLDRSALTAAVNGIEPRGYTPIGNALRTAAAELPAEGPRSIVLVSDGEDTCAPPEPCEVAGELAKQGVDLRIHTVGFDVTGLARQQLSCVAEATGGTYSDAPDPATLSRVLNRVAQRALRLYDAVGTPIDGTPQPAGAPPVTPGAYLDRLGFDESNHYSVDMPAGYTLYAGATVVAAAPREVYTLLVRRYAADGRECPDYASEVKLGKEPVVTAALRWQAPASDDADDSCGRAGKQYVRVWLETTGGVNDRQESPMELQIGLEPPLTGDAGPAGTTEKTQFTAPAGPATPVSGGGSFNTATTLDGTGSYADTVLSGEMVFYRVRVNWGQGVAYRVRLGEQPDDFPKEIHTYLFSPSRHKYDDTFDVYDGKPLTVPDDADAIATPPILYRNRELNDDDSTASVAGWYYIGVFIEHATGNADDPPAAVPTTIDVSVGGAAGARPAYAGDATKDAFGDGPGKSEAGGPGASAKDQGVWTTVASNGPLLWLGGLALALVLLGGTVILGLVIRHRQRGGRRNPTGQGMTRH